MDDPFFQTCYPNGDFYSPSVPRPQPKKKVVSIPVRFVASEQSKSDSALKIQKAFRGFLVRKNVNKILGIRRQVDLVEKKLLERETVDLIKKDSKERLKLNESLMNLLFSLDSVRSVNPAVRDCRKATINKALMLQEKIDSFIAQPIGSEGELKERTDNSGGNQVEIFEDVNNCGSNHVEILENMNDGGGIGVEISENVNNPEAAGVEVVDDMNKNNSGIEIPETIDEAWECVGEGTEEKSLMEKDKCQGGNSAKRSSDEWCVVRGDEDEEEESKRSRKLLEKMAEDNQKLMAMVAQLCDHTAAQASLISSLSHRVEHLEKVVNDNTSRKKKKKKILNGATFTTAP